MTMEAIPEQDHDHKAEKPSLKNSSIFYFSSVITFVLIFILFQIQILRTTHVPQYSPSSHSPSFSSSPWPLTLFQNWEKLTNTTSSQKTHHEEQPTSNMINCTSELKSMATKLKDSVTFLPLKDLRFSNKPLEGHTWFMSSMFDKQQKGEIQYQKYPSESSKGRLLCIKGHDIHDGSWNYYGFAFPEALPENATLLKGLTFVSYNHYVYDNIWHGLSALVPFVAWHARFGGCGKPTRWVLYHRGELRGGFGNWGQKMVEATFGEGGTKVEMMEEGVGGGGACFEEVVVMRHNEGGMSKERRLEVYDLLRCKARVYCNVSLEGRDNGGGEIGLSMLMRSGARSFKNDSAVIQIFERECVKVDGCRFTVAYSNNLSFCQQVSLMSSTDILVSPHGAQLTNLFLMDRNSSVMEFFPKGWLKLAGVGQFVYHWISDWSGMKHQGAWRDPEGESCEYSEDSDMRCFAIFKNGLIGHNETHFSQWARKVLSEVKKNKQEQQQKQKQPSKQPRTMEELKEASGCACG